MDLKKETGGVLAAKGFQAAAAAAEIKYSGRDDMALIFCPSGAEAAGTFTTNVVKAAPVLWDQTVVRNGKKVHAVVVNSGIANACTGEKGRRYCQQTADAVAQAFSIQPEEVLIASTGVIGAQLPMDRIRAGIRKMAPLLSDAPESASAAARAIMTTDTHDKQTAVSFAIGGKKVTIGAMAKGSGMIHPNMCTMLSFVTTDCAIDRALLQEALSETVADTYNMISVDGDTSTNDTCLLLASGLAGNDRITEKNEDYRAFCKALFEVNRNIARQMAGDGEGATALFEVKVVGADTAANAKILAKSVITSNLTKAAIFGHDANWGRILCALGYSGVSFDPEKVDLTIESKAGKLLLASGGAPADYSEEEASRILSEEEVACICQMHMGDASATAWGCDLTYDYVKINADYRS